MRSEQGHGQEAKPRLLGPSFSSRSLMIQPKKAARHGPLLGYPIGAGGPANHRCHSPSTRAYLLKQKRHLKAKLFILPDGVLDVRLSCEPPLTLFHTGWEDVCSLNPGCLVSINALCLWAVPFPAGHEPSGLWHLHGVDMDVSELSKQWIPHPSLYMWPKWPTFPTCLNLKVL